MDVVKTDLKYCLTIRTSAVVGWFIWNISGWTSGITARFSRVAAGMWPSSYECNYQYLSSRASEAGTWRRRYTSNVQIYIIQKVVSTFLDTN